nr:MAG TPA: hypothetical protein [Caudoviricetes sp.]
MKFVDNANLTTFLLNAPVELQIFTDDNRFVRLFLRMPTITELFCDNSLQIVLGILNTPEDKLQGVFGQVSNLTYYNLLIILNLHKDEAIFSQYLSHFYKAFEIFGLHLFLNGSAVIINDISFNEEAFNYLRQLLLIMVKIKTKQDALLEQDQTYKKSQEMIARIKKQGQTTKDGDKNFEKNFITLQYEFGLSLPEIYNLNIYQYETILSYTSNVLNYKVSTIAAGNGLTKKINFITQGGKK